MLENTNFARAFILTLISSVAVADGANCERLIGDSPQDYELRWSKMFAHPAVEIGTEVTEVRRLVEARGEAIEPDEQVRDEFSHRDSSNRQGGRPAKPR